MLKEKLKNLGFSDNEAGVYVALLELGDSVVSEIAKKAELNRSTAYVTLEFLAKRGLVSISEEADKARLYKPTSPERLIQILAEEARKATELVEVAKNIVPDLQAVQQQNKAQEASSTKKYDIRYYEGLEGMKTVYEDTLTATETIRVYASVENTSLALPSYFPEYVKRRTEKGIETRVIFPNTEEATETVMGTIKKAGQKGAFLVPKEEYAFSPEINVYDDKVAFLSFQEKYGLIIQSEELTGALKKIFEMSWKGAEQLHRKIYPRMTWLIGLFLFFALWWVALAFVGFTTPASSYNQLFGVLYGIIALCGGILGLLIAKKRGGIRSAIGKSIFFFAIGLFSQEVGQLIYSVYIFIWKINIPYPSIGDLFFYGTIPLYIMGIISLAKASDVQLSLKSFLKKSKMMLVPMMVLVASYATLLQIYTFDWTQPLKIFLDFAVPLSQTFYISIALLIFLDSKNIPNRLMKYRALGILIALFIQYAADFSFIHAAAKGTYVAGNYVDVIYMIAYFAMTLAILSFDPDYFRKFSTAKSKAMAPMWALPLTLGSAWWITSSFLGWNNASWRENILWVVTSQSLALFGAIFAFVNIKKWGGIKNNRGKTILFFGLGLLFQFFGAIIFSVYTGFLHVEVPYPSLAEIGYFGSLIFYICAIALLGKVLEQPITRKFIRQHGLLLSLALLVFTCPYILVFKNYAPDWAQPTKIFFDFAYPVGDILYMSMATMIYLSSKQMFRGHMKYQIGIIVMALLFQYIGDYTFFYQAAHGTWANGSYGDAIFTLAYFIMAIALLSFNPDYFRKFSTKAQNINVE